MTAPAAAPGEGLPVAHELKVWPAFYVGLADGTKPFEVRKNDRNFAKGDTLRLREWDHVGGYTGRAVEHVVSYVLHGPAFGIEAGYVVLGLARRAPPAPAMDSDSALVKYLWDRAEIAIEDARQSSAEGDEVADRAAMRMHDEWLKAWRMASAHAPPSPPPGSAPDFGAMARAKMRPAEAAAEDIMEVLRESGVPENLVPTHGVIMALIEQRYAANRTGRAG